MFPKPSQMGGSNARLPPTGSSPHYPMLRVCPANQRTPTRRHCRTWTARLSLPSTGTEPGSKPAQDPIRPAAPAAVEDRSVGGTARRTRRPSDHIRKGVRGREEAVRLGVRAAQERVQDQVFAEIGDAKVEVLRAGRERRPY